MKKPPLMTLPLLTLIVAAILPPAHAQLIPGVLNQVGNATRQVDNVAEQLRRKTEQDLERLKPSVDKLAITTDKLLDPVLKLPAQLPILNRDGQAAFVDVEVENGWRAIQREWLVTIDESELTALQYLPIEIIEQTRFADLGITILRFRVPPELDSLSALQKILPATISAKLDRNHVYSTQANTDTQSYQPSRYAKSACNDSVSIGMIDTAIKLDHPAFKNETSSIVSKNFLEEKLPEPDAHGTAIAGLFIGSEQGLTPLLPKASLYAASVFYSRSDSAQGASMMNLVRALNWMVSEDIKVINMSLAGPDNQILAKVIEKIINSGKVIVAAAGNQGPASPPLFPAAYPGVIAVTAVDRDKKIYRWANRGSQISFSALGVAVPVISTSGGIHGESGTSMAAPVVAALLSCELQKNISVKDAINNLINNAIDLGAKGKDEIFGYGFLK